MNFRLLLLPLLLALAPEDAGAGNTTFRAGLYEISFRLELPHLERYATNRKRMVCIGPLRHDRLKPVFGGNEAFANCVSRKFSKNKAILAYDILCPGRGSARAEAVYRFTVNGFSGRIAMVLGAKNMTMTEVQNGRRLGLCDFAGVPEN